MSKPRNEWRNEHTNLSSKTMHWHQQFVTPTLDPCREKMNNQPEEDISYLSCVKALLGYDRLLLGQQIGNRITSDSKTSQKSDTSFTRCKNSSSKNYKLFPLRVINSYFFFFSLPSSRFILNGADIWGIFNGRHPLFLLPFHWLLAQGCLHPSVWCHTSTHLVHSISWT